MDSPTLRELPKEGQTYLSLNGFKLDTYRAVVDQKVRVDPVRQSVHMLQLYCTVRARTKGDNCPFGARACWRGSESTGVFVVVESCSRHSCGIEQNELAQKSAEVYMNSELQKLESSLVGEAGSSHGSSGGSSKPVGGYLEGVGEAVSVSRVRKLSERAMAMEQDPESSDNEDWSGSGSAEHKKTTLLKTTTTSANPFNPNSTAPTPPPPSTSKLVHPRAAALEDQIRELANAGPLAFPPSKQLTFASHTDFRVHASAAAFQRGFVLILRYKGVNAKVVDAGKAFSLRCARCRPSSTSAEICPAYVAFGLGEDDRWRVTSSDGRHNHSLNPPQLDWQDKEETRSKKKARLDVERVSAEAPPSPNSPVASSSTPQPPPSPSKDTYKMVYSHPLASPLLAPQVPPRLPPQSLFPRSTPQHLGRPSSSPSPGFPSSPSNSSGTDFLPTLTLFLKSLSTSLSIPALAPNLLNAGVDSKEKFILLLSLTENSLSRCIEDLCEKEGVSKLQRLLLTKALKEARGKALGVEETKEEAKS